MEGTRRKVMVVPVRITSRWEVLLFQRGPDKGNRWQPVTGNVDPGEDLDAAAARELREETGLGSQAAVRAVGHVHRFSKETGAGSTEFEEHVYVAVVRLGSRVQLSHEHVASRWLPTPEALEMLVEPGVRHAVEQALLFVGAGA